MIQEMSTGTIQSEPKTELEQSSISKNKIETTAICKNTIYIHHKYSTTYSYHGSTSSSETYLVRNTDIYFTCFQGPFNPRTSPSAQKNWRKHEQPASSFVKVKIYTLIRASTE